MGRRLAVVPVLAVDHRTVEALAYAASLAEQVLAVHVRLPVGDSQFVENRWRHDAGRPPLLVVDAPGGDCAVAFNRALDVLRRAEPLDEITVVVPTHARRGEAAADWRDTLHSTATARVTRTPAL